MITALALIAGISLVFALTDWRRGLLFCIAVGFLQDPIRKFLPGQPVQLVIGVAIAFVICLFGVFVRGDSLDLGKLLRTFPRLRVPVAMFVVIVAAQSVRTWMTIGSPILAGLGVLAYLSPPIALLVGNRYCNDFRSHHRWLLAYLLGAFVVGATVLLQFSGFEPTLFSSIGIEYVYGGPTGIVRMMSGIMRSSEIAAWHLAAGACILIAVAAAAGTQRMRWPALAGALLLILGVILTGRRKMLAEIGLFLLVYGFLVGQYRRGGSRIAQSAMAVVFLLVIVLQLFGTSAQVAELAPYLGRGASVVADSGERLYDMTVSQFNWIVQYNGLLGAGAGTGAQGSQYFGGGTEIIGGGAEGGLGKVLAELGLPGALALIWLGVAISRVVLRIARFARRAPPSQALLLYGLIAFLPANAVVFLTAHQVFGDPFVLIVLGLVTGSILAFPRMWLVEQREAAPRAVARAAPLWPRRRLA
jgi:hypothetical protein